MVMENDRGKNEIACDSSVDSYIAMNYTSVLSSLTTISSSECPEKTLAILANRWVLAESERSRERGEAAAADPIVQGIIARGSSAVLMPRLASYECGWTPQNGYLDRFNDSNVRPPPRTATPPASPPPGIVVYCDGSCTNNGRAGARAGYGVYVTDNGVEKHRHSARLPESDAQTNQRAELLALMYALQYLGESGGTGTIYTDSKYAMQCVQTWGPTWETAGWKKADKKPILHLDIIQPLCGLWNMVKSRVTLQHVAGHSGLSDPISRGNAMADTLARGATESTA